MDLDNIKRGLRAEIKKRENEQYATFQCNVRQMCKDVLAKLEEQESVIADKDKQLRYANYKRCLRNAESCLHLAWYYIEVRERLLFRRRGPAHARGVETQRLFPLGRPRLRHVPRFAQRRNDGPVGKNEEETVLRRTSRKESLFFPETARHRQEYRVRAEIQPRRKESRPLTWRKTP